VSRILWRASRIRSLVVGKAVSAQPVRQHCYVIDPADEGVTERMRLQALVIALTIRNAMEEFHSSPRGPTDEQMAILNPIIRNGALTALHALGAYHGRRRDWAAAQLLMVPKYWEPPRLLPDYVEYLQANGGGSRYDEWSSCKYCDQPIYRRPDGKWNHDDPDRSRACRTASFRPDEGWDDSLKRSWVATPQRL
jgi:hypothetical protein